MKRFVWADQHLGHENVLTFEHEGSPLRPFKTIEEMHECLIDNHNSIVRPVDKVYWAGDVVIKRKYLPILDKFNGRKVLVKGNHDIFKLEDYLLYFEDIRSIVVFPYRGVITHVPIHPQCLERESWAINIHGHMHAHKVMKEVYWEESHENYAGIFKSEDTRYKNVSVEQINYTPVELESLLLPKESS